MRPGSCSALAACSCDRLRGVAAAVTIAAAAEGAGAAGIGAVSGLQPLAGLREEVLLAGAVVGSSRLDVHRFVDERSPEVLRAEIRTAWSGRPAPVHGFGRDGWLVLVQVDGAAVETVEMRANGAGTQGRRSRLARDAAGSSDTSAWLVDVLPRGSRVLERMSHLDGGRRMTTLVALTSSSAAVAWQELVAALGRKGFGSSPGTSPSFVGREGAVRFFARAGDEIAVTMSELDGQRALVMHWGRAAP